MKSLRLTRPHAIMLVGLPGSGKTFFASKFAETFNAPFIDSLQIEDRARDADSAGELISLVLNEIAKTHQTFVFEGNTDSRVRRTEFTRWARSKGYQPLLVWVQVDHPTARTRSIKSNSMPKDDFELAIKQFSAPHREEAPIVISGKHTYASQAKVVLSHLVKEKRIEQPATIQTTTPTDRTTPRPAAPHSRSITVR